MDRGVKRDSQDERHRSHTRDERGTRKKNDKKNKKWHLEGKCDTREKMASG